MKIIYNYYYCYYYLYYVHETVQHNMHNNTWNKKIIKLQIFDHYVIFLFESKELTKFLSFKLNRHHNIMQQTQSFVATHFLHISISSGSVSK